MKTVVETTPKSATIKGETGVYKHLNGQTFEIGQYDKSGWCSLLIPRFDNHCVLVDFPAKNLQLNY